MEQVSWARDLAGRLLAEPLPRRWSHTQGVARKAETVASILGDDGALLVAAAWLHDVGYAPKLAETGFHPLDGARYLRDVEQADDRLCRLVAHHSGAMVEARLRDLDADLATEFEPVRGLLAEALTYCDMTTSPDGDPVDVATRLDEIATRYGATDIVTRSIEESRPGILQGARDMEARLRDTRSGA